jgi:hypothetical protein
MGILVQKIKKRQTSNKVIEVTRGQKTIGKPQELFFPKRKKNKNFRKINISTHV